MRHSRDVLLWLGAGVLLGWGSKDCMGWLYRRIRDWTFPTGPLKLTRPLVTFDIESTGTNVAKDRIVEIAAIKLFPDGQIEVKGPQRINPGIKMSEEVIAIHGITDDDVADCPVFGDVAQDWKEFFTDCDLHGYNARKFDVPLLRSEFRRSGIFDFPELGVPIVDSFQIFVRNEPRNLGAALQFYCGKQQPAGTAHTALADAQATLDVLIGQVQRYKQLPRSVCDLARYCAAPSRAQDVTNDGKFQWRGQIPIVAFGKYTGEPLAVLISKHQDYLRWMSAQDFSDETQLVVAQALKGLLPTKDGGWQPLVFEPAKQ